MFVGLNILCDVHEKNFLILKIMHLCHLDPPVGGERSIIRAGADGRIL